MEILRKRNASDGDSGFDSALSSRSSSISLEEESQELLDFKISKVEVSDFRLRDKYSSLLTPDEDIVQDASTPGLFLIKDRVSGVETSFKPPSRLSFNNAQPQVETTYSKSEYNRSNPIPRSQLFNARLQLELEKQVFKMESVEVDLLMDNNQVPPPSLGIRVIGVNMIHGVPDKLNIYVKKVMEDSVAGQDGRIRVNDHIVEVNGVSLVGVSQKLAAEALSSCAVNPETGVVHFVLARPPQPPPAQPQDDPNLQHADINGNVVDAAGPNLKPPAAGVAEPNHPSDLPVLPAAICGESNAFIPRTEEASSAPTSGAEVEGLASAQQRSVNSGPSPPSGGVVAPSLSDLPGSLLVHLASYLTDRRDRISLSRVNSSFYTILKEYLPKGNNLTPSSPRGQDLPPPFSEDLRPAPAAAPVAGGSTSGAPLSVGGPTSCAPAPPDLTGAANPVSSVHPEYPTSRLKEMKLGSEVIRAGDGGVAKMVVPQPPHLLPCV